MTRKRTRRRVVVPLPPPGLRPKLDASQVRDLSLCHFTNLDMLVRGEGTEETLWHWIGGALTWSYVAQQLQTRNPEAYAEAAQAMLDQLTVAEAVVQRYGRTGRIGLSGPEYQLAREACAWMDALAEVVDKPTALLAAECSEQRVNAMAAQSNATRLQAA